MITEGPAAASLTVVDGTTTMARTTEVTVAGAAAPAIRLTRTSPLAAARALMTNSSALFIALMAATMARTSRLSAIGTLAPSRLQSTGSKPIRMRRRHH